MKWLLLLLLLIPLVSASSSENFASDIILITGGGQPATSENFASNEVVGIIAENSASENFNSCFGFWCAYPILVSEAISEGMEWLLAVLLGYFGMVAMFMLLGWKLDSRWFSGISYMFSIAFIMILLNTSMIGVQAHRQEVLDSSAYNSIFSLQETNFILFLVVVGMIALISVVAMFVYFFGRLNKT